MKVSDFDYALPAELIAQEPLSGREQSRLMVINRKIGKLKHSAFSELPNYINQGDVLVLNDTRVIPARLEGVKTKTGGKVEILLLNRLDDYRWEVLMKPARRLSPGAKIVFDDEKLQGVIEERKQDGKATICFSYSGDFKEILNELGELPLPPYICKPLSCPERYQTVYGKDEESAAAPTAGLHFSDSLLERVGQKGIDIAYVTLRIGLDTFRPIRTEEIERHEIHSEHFKIDKKSADMINKAKVHGRRVIAVGTTSTRAIEAAAKRARGSGLRSQKRMSSNSEESDYLLEPCQGQTDLFIYPGYEFKIIDGMLTNFHLPKSTLLMMVAAFGGCKLILDAYKQAIVERYRFFSFGDAMLIL